LEPDDSLVLSVWDHVVGKPHELLGTATLHAGHIRRTAFHAELPLTCVGTLEPVAHLKVRVSRATWSGRDTPFFSSGWTCRNTGVGGMRNDWDGDVGFSFIPQTPVIVLALGRQVQHGAKLREAVLVTLWSVDVQAALASASVGPQSVVEVGYAFSSLVSDILLEAGKEYRISQQCTRGMADPWFDGAAPDVELTQCLTTRYVLFCGSVYTEGFGFPDIYDADLAISSHSRRAGMLNFKMKGEDPAAEALQLQCSGADPNAIVLDSIAGGSAATDQIGLHVLPTRCGTTCASQSLQDLDMGSTNCQHVLCWHIQGSVLLAQIHQPCIFLGSVRFPIAPIDKINCDSAPCVSGPEDARLSDCIFQDTMYFTSS